VELYLRSPNSHSWRGAQKKKHRDKFTFNPSHPELAEVPSMLRNY